MSSPGWIAFGIVSSALLATPQGDPPSSPAEVKLDRDFLAAILARSPPCPFEKAGQYRGKVDSFRLVAIDPKARKLRVSCTVAGEFDERAVVAGLSKSAKTPGQAPAPPAASKWRKFRFDVRLAVNVEPGPDGAPKLRFDVEEVKRRELEGTVGPLAMVMGKGFDRVVTAFADKKAEGLNDRLNAEVAKRVASFKDYGFLCGVDYFATHVVVRFDQTRYRSEGVAGYVYLTPRPGTTPLYRWVNPRHGDHLFTTGQAEPDRRAYRSEGIACHVLARGEPGAAPFYRWRGKRECVYTTAPDVVALRHAGFRPDGVACHVFAAQVPDTVPIYRFVDPRSGLHFFTIDPHAEFAK
jgi:hypothetical protein